jgi:signal transduction histidine kinase
MRNPLLAIVQCANSIISTHKAFGSSTDHDKIYQSILESTIDAAKTIVQCSKHMKTIVDGVLTMSKIDSGLFVVTPVDVELGSIAKGAVKMLEGEARSAGIDIEFQLEETCKQIDIESVSLDPTRVLQILINLITNAIKFTRLERPGTSTLAWIYRSNDLLTMLVDTYHSFAHPRRRKRHRC